MKISTFSMAVVASGLLMAAPAIAQTSGTTSSTQSQPTAQKQHTQSNPAGQYNFAPASGSYAPRATTQASKQRTDGEDVTGNNNFAPASK